MVTHKSRLRRQTASSLSFFLGLAALLMILALVVVLANQSPAQSSTLPTASAPSLYQTYRDKNYNYTIEYPTAWHIADQAEGVLTLSSVFDPAEAARGGTNFSQRKLLDSTPATVAVSLNKLDVIAFNLESEMSVADFMTAKSSVAPEGHITALKIGGLPALKVETQVAEALKNHTDDVTYTSVFVTAGKHGYIIAGVAPASQFDYIISSFRPL